MSDTKLPEETERTKLRMAHDAYVKFMWKDVERAKTMLRACLPAELRWQCNWDGLSLLDGSFVDPNLKAKHTDILYSASIGPKQALLYVVFEHKSDNDETAVMQVLGYELRALERYKEAREKKGERVLPLPLVLPILFHHSERGWKSPTSMVELFGEPAKEHPEMVPWLPQYQVILHDLSHKSDEELRESALDIVSLVAMWALRDGRSPGKVAAGMDLWAGALGKAIEAPGGKEAITATMEYLLNVCDDLDGARIQSKMIEVEPRTKEAVMTAAEKLIAQGEAKGIHLGQSGMLLWLLAKKFGNVPESVQKRVQDASENELTTWAERILFADSLEAVFAAE